MNQKANENTIYLLMEYDCLTLDDYIVRAFKNKGDAEDQLKERKREIKGSRFLAPLIYIKEVPYTT